MTMSIRRAEGRFRQLCCLGLAGEAVIPALLVELHTIVRRPSTTFHFADEAGLPVNIYSDHPGFIDLMPLYSELFYERRDREFKGLAYSEASRRQFGVDDADAALGPGWSRFSAAAICTI